jgi:acyl carrier protein
MTDPIEFQVLQTASDVFGVPLAQLNAESSPQTVEGWDSVQHLNLVLALEQNLAIQIDPEDIEQMKTLGDVARILRGKRSAG